MAWITTDKTGGSGSGTIAVSASDNTVLSSRNGTIIITNGNTTKAVSVVQYSKPSITRQPPYTMAKAEGSDIYITVKCYSEWWFRSIYDWITIIDGNGNTVTEGSRQASTGDGTRTFTFRLSGNTAATSRNDTISIGYLRLDGTEVTEKLRVPTYTIEQYGQTQKQSLPQPPSQQDITPSTSTLSWNATTDADWITLIKSTGVKGESVTYTVTENTGDEKRTGKITITYSDGSVEIIEVTQKGVMSVYDIDIEADSYDDVAASGGTKTITVTCNSSWTLSSDTEGVTFSPASGTGDGTATMTIPENAGGGRSIKVTGTSSGGRTDSFTIAQAATIAENFSVIPSSISADYGSGNQTLKVVTNTNWSISSVPDWIGCIVDGTTVTVTVQKNDTGSERSGNIIFTYGTGSSTYTVPVTQKANLQEISLKASTPYVYGENATAYLYITCEGAWTLEGGDGYALFDKNSGKGNATVLVTFSGIGEGEAKALTFTATSSNTATATINYLYEKPYIVVSDEGLGFNPESESKKITIDSNICWTVEEYSEPVTENTKIYYTPIDDNIVTPTTLSATDADGNELTYTNTYSDGQGVIEFSGVVADITIKFQSCTTLKTFDGISNKVKLASDASRMFSDCDTLRALVVSNFDTSSVTDMSYMFYGCTALTSLNISEWDTSSVTDMSSMFDTCSSLTTLKIGFNCKIGSSTTRTYMQYNLPSSGTLQYPSGMGSTQVARWTPSDWTKVAY